MSYAHSTGTWRRQGRTIVLFPGGATANPGSFGGPEELEGEFPEIPKGFSASDEARMTDTVFYNLHPERRGRRLAVNEAGFQKLRDEWLHIRDRIVRPALAAAASLHGPGPR
jgi:hypothetical protein